MERSPHRLPTREDIDEMSRRAKLDPYAEAGRRAVEIYKLLTLHYGEPGLVNALALLRIALVGSRRFDFHPQMRLMFENELRHVEQHYGTTLREALNPTPKQTSFHAPYGAVSAEDGRW